MTVYGRLMVCLVLVLVTTCGPIQGFSEEQRVSSLAQVRATGEDIHAIVNSIAIGQKPTFEGTRGEFPIRRTVHLLVPKVLAPHQHAISVMLQGIVVAQAADNAYADPLQAWQGFKTHAPEREKMKTSHKGVGLKVTLDNTAPEEFALWEIYNYGEITRGRVTIRHVQYSFKQNRILLLIQPETPITALEILTGDLDAAYLGFFRVHLFGPVMPVRSEETKVRFEWYGQQDREIPVGQPLALSLASVYEGDFLYPVGLWFAAENEAKTSRALTGLLPGGHITIEVAGIFLFSGFHAFTAIGGSGGWQDIAYRYDHARFGLASQFLRFYPINKPISVLTHHNDFRFIIYDTAGKEIEYVFKPIPKSHWQLQSSSIRHRYKVEFTAPPDGRVYFFINDNAIRKTRDNNGAFLVRVLAQSQR